MYIIYLVCRNRCQFHRVSKTLSNDIQLNRQPLNSTMSDCNAKKSQVNLGFSGPPPPYSAVSDTPQHYTEQSPYPQQHYPGQSPCPQQHYPGQSPCPQQHYPGQSPCPQQHYPGQSPYPQQHPYSPNTGQQPSFCGPAVVQTQPMRASFAVIQQRNKPPNYVVLSFVTCLCFNCFFGLYALVLSNQSDTAFESGDIEDARRKGQAARRVSIGGVVCSLVSVAIIVPLVVLSY